MDRVIIMFNQYRTRLGYYGYSDQECMKKQNTIAKDKSFTFSQSYREVIINGNKYDARITEDVGDTIKTGNGNFQIEFRDDIVFHPGTYVQIQNAFGEWEYWMLIDVLDELIVTKTLIKKCAHEIAWKNKSGDIIKRWICFDDAYKLYDGSRNYGYKTNLPDASLVAIMPIDDETINIRRDHRFIIDAPNTDEPPDAWVVTNRSIASSYHNGYGVISFSLQQDYFNFETDNAELMIADYFVHPDKKETEFVPGIAYAKIFYNGKGRIVVGTGKKVFTAKFYSKFGLEIPNVECVWNVKILPELEQFFTIDTKGDTLAVSAINNENIFNYNLHIEVSNMERTISEEIVIKVVSGI